MTIELVTNDETVAILKATVDGVGKDEFTYKWMHNGEHVPEETRDTFIIENPKKNDEGEYVCNIWNKFGDEAKSNSVYLTIVIMKST